MLILLDSFLATPVLKHAWGTAYEGELYLKQGARLSLKCEIANTTIAEITWYKSDDPLPSQRYSSKGVIDIQKTSADDFGVYECKAKNSLGVASKKIKVVNGEEHFKRTLHDTYFIRELTGLHLSLRKQPRSSSLLAPYRDFLPSPLARSKEERLFSPAWSSYIVFLCRSQRPITHS